jgi:hypothetical protein
MLTGETLYNMFVAGGYYVIQNKESLNKINVFPVPDGDTGTNLASTFYSIIENGKVYQSAGKTMQSIAEEAITGARGNSGIILAQFLSGLSSGLGEVQTITVEHFSKAVNKAVAVSFKAINNPVEGTMLSIIRDWAEVVVSLSHKLSDFYNLFSKSLVAANKMLKETTSKLMVLKENHVVDAGAKGFVHFLQGIEEFIKTGKLSQKKLVIPKVKEENHLEIHEQLEIPYRYCTEALIKADNIDQEQLKKTLSRFGDSLIVAGTDHFVRIHIHTNQPALLFEKLSPIGSLMQQKADDMVRQQEVVYKRKHNIALVTDSACDLPQELIDQHQIHMIPLHLTIDENQYLDKVTIAPHQFYELLDTSTNYPSTSQPAVGDVGSLFSFLSSYYDSIIAVHLASALSGTFNVSKQEAEKIQNTEITVADSKNLSGSLGLIVLRIAEEIEAGKSFKEISENIDSYSKKANLWVSVPSLKYLVRGGRVSPLKGAVAKLLNLKPIVSLDSEGNSTLHGKAFSKRSNKKKIIKMVTDIAARTKLHSYAVVHAHAFEEANNYAAILTEKLDMEPLYIMDISPVIGLHAGKGTVSIVTMRE